MLRHCCANRHDAEMVSGRFDMADLGGSIPHLSTKLLRSIELLLLSLTTKRMGFDSPFGSWVPHVLSVRTYLNFTNKEAECHVL